MLTKAQAAFVREAVKKEVLHGDYRFLQAEEEHDLVTLAELVCSLPELVGVHFETRPGGNLWQALYDSTGWPLWMPPRPPNPPQLMPEFSHALNTEMNEARRAHHEAAPGAAKDEAKRKLDEAIARVEYANQKLAEMHVKHYEMTRALYDTSGAPVSV